MNSAEKMFQQSISKVKNQAIVRSSLSYIGNFFKSKTTYQQIQNTLDSSSEIVLVYQMGKVGSSTIVRTLEASNIPQPIYKIHFLNPDTNLQRWQHQKSYKSLLAPNYLIIDQYFCENIAHLVAQKDKIKMITSVRDPIGRGISSFFQNISNFLPNVYQMIETKEINVDNLIKLYWEHPEAQERRYRALNWFDQEFNSVLGIDIFSIDFPKSQGYLIQKNINKNIDLLIIKLEAFSPYLQPCLKDFLQIDEVTIVNANMSNSKRYYELYQTFRNKINFPVEYLDNIYDSRFVKFFYTDKEINNFKKKWSKSI
ncbi:MAG: putative capsular polysaccharide synthesis family protein [Spirulinaceae cyanobacterium]